MKNLAERRAARSLEHLTLDSAASDPPLDVPPALSLPRFEDPFFDLDQKTEDSTVVSAFVRYLAALGVEQAFGVSGGAIALLFDALAESPIALHHFRHETGAAFAATEAHFATGKPTALFTTTGPGLLNALTGITAARWDGAKVILVSGHTNSQQRGRWATQETSAYTMPQDVLYSRGALFDFATRMEQASELPNVLRRLANGLAGAGSFVAHIAMPMSVQSSHVEARLAPPRVTATHPALSSRDIAECVHRLREQPFAIWAGFGATRASEKVRRLAERTGAKIFVSPRGKGIVPEDHPNYLGVTGLGGHEVVTEYMLQQRPKYILVLGSRLGEATSFWDNDMVPSGGFIHVDLDPEVPGVAFPDTPTLGIQAEIGQFLDQLLEHFPTGGCERVLTFDATGHRPWDAPPPMRLAGRSPVRPQVLMQAIQRRVVDGSDALVLAECGNSFAWCNHYLRFRQPGRYRVSTLFGSMGHTAAGVVGAAIARRRKAVAVVGDGSMLMQCEISSAVQYDALAVWVVLNDAGYGMCRDGHRALGLTGQDIDFPCVDFVQLAQSQGADGVRVETEDMVDSALEQALAARGPFVVDVRVDPQEASPLLRRFESLIRQGNSKNVAGWET